MRRCLTDLVRFEDPDHLGLAYDVWAPVEPGTGKVPEDRKTKWLECLCRMHVAADYASAFERWRDSLAADGTRTAVVTFRSRLLLGHGNPAPTEVGLTVHHTWGVPVIPGSALKGLLSHYVEAAFGPDKDAPWGHPMDPAPSLSEAERQRAGFQGVTWSGNRIEHGPGQVYRVLFGAPAAATDEKFAEQGAGETQGAVVFHDALYVPEGPGQPFALDVLTVHQKRYYDHCGATSGPNDYGSPIPVNFLTVKPGVKFLLALGGAEGWSDFAMTHLLTALDQWGIGAKTTSGYGRAVASHPGRVSSGPTNRDERGGQSHDVQSGEGEPARNASVSRGSLGKGATVRCIVLPERSKAGNVKVRVKGGEGHGIILDQWIGKPQPRPGHVVDLVVESSTNTNNMIFRWSGPAKGEHRQ